MDRFRRLQKYVFVTNSKKDNVGFNTGEWNRVFFLEMMLGIYWSIRTAILLSVLAKSEHSKFFFVVCIIGIPLQFLKPVLVYRGIARRSPTRLRIYCRLNQILFPLYPIVKLYIWWISFILKPSNLKFSMLALEMVATLATGSAWFWLAYCSVPKHLKKLHMSVNAMTEFKQKIDEYLFNATKEIGSSGNPILENSLCKQYVNLDESSAEVETETLLNSLITPLDLHIDMSQKIGEGQFSLVYKGILRKDGKTLEIVGKTGKVGENSLEALVKEMKIVLHVGVNPNILGFFGVTCGPTAGSYFLISEFCTMGSLHSYLDKIRPTVSGFCSLLQQEDRNYVNVSQGYMEQELAQLRQELQRYSVEICAGMSHLTEKRVVHGDLALRNVLLNGDLKVKLSDFGMSERLYNYQPYLHNFEQEFVPWRWMSVEALEDLRFSEKSDVWAFGVTLFELYTLGRLPFEGQDWSLTLPDDIRAGLYSLGRPEFATDEINDIISRCCAVMAENRPTFQELYKLLLHV